MPNEMVPMPNMPRDISRIVNQKLLQAKGRVQFGQTDRDYVVYGPDGTQTFVKERTRVIEFEVNE